MTNHRRSIYDNVPSLPGSETETGEENRFAILFPRMGLPNEGTSFQRNIERIHRTPNNVTYVAIGEDDEPSFNHSDSRVFRSDSKPPIHPQSSMQQNYAKNITR